MFYNGSFIGLAFTDTMWAVLALSVFTNIMLTIAILVGRRA